MEDFRFRILQMLGDLVPYVGSEFLSIRICDAIRQLLGVDNVYLVSIQGELLANWHAGTAGYSPQPLSMEVIRNAIRQEHGYYVSNIDGNPSESQVSQRISCCAAARVDLGESPIGAFYVEVRQGPRRFSQDDGRSLKQLGDLLAVYVRCYEMQFERIDKESVPQATPILIGESSRIQQLRREVVRIAQKATQAILIEGEPGTGKEVIAQMIHQNSDRKFGPLIPVNCAAVSGTLFESEFFGHEKGAFSDAHSARKGKIRAAHRGTLFLDEVGDIPLEQQAKLLRVLQCKRVTPLGLDHEVGPIDFRLICASNKNLKSLLSKGEFRQDFYDRISGVRIKVPPLRDRLEDIPLLATSFAQPRRICDEAVALLRSLDDWSGNVRKLKTVVENARDLCDGNTISKDDILFQLLQQGLISEDGRMSATPLATVSFDELKTRYKYNRLEPGELDRLLWPAYIRCGTWPDVAKTLFGLPQGPRSRECTNWVYQRQVKKEICRSYAQFLRRYPDHK